MHGLSSDGSQSALPKSIQKLPKLSPLPFGISKISIKFQELQNSQISKNSKKFPKFQNSQNFQKFQNFHNFQKFLSQKFLRIPKFPKSSPLCFGKIPSTRSGDFANFGRFGNFGIFGNFGLLENPKFPKSSPLCLGKSRPLGLGILEILEILEILKILEFLTILEILEFLELIFRRADYDPSDDRPCTTTHLQRPGEEPGTPESRVPGSSSRVSGSRVPGSGSRVPGPGFRVTGDEKKLYYAKSLQNSVSKRGAVVEPFFCQPSNQLAFHFWSLGLSVGARKIISNGFLPT